MTANKEQIKKKLKESTTSIRNIKSTANRIKSAVNEVVEEKKEHKNKDP
jgi:gas vesicle protein